MPGHILNASCDSCGYGTLTRVGAGNDGKLYVAAFDPSRREVVAVDDDVAKAGGWTIYPDPWLDNAPFAVWGREPYEPAPGSAKAFTCPLCGREALCFHLCGFWD
jgi:hypothetical protein